jgi:chemotaxis protein MotB
VRVSTPVVTRLCVIALLGIPGLGGCVSKVHYDRCVSDAAQAHDAAESKRKEQDARIQSIQNDLATAQSAVQDCDSRVSDLSTANHNIQTQLDEATAINQQLRTELERLGRDVDKMLSERGTLSKALDDAKARLDELRKAQAAAQARADLFRALASKFKPLVDAKQMRIEARRGQSVIEVSSDLLFEPAHSELRPTGKGTLMEIAHALQSTASEGGRRFLVTSVVDGPEGKGKTAKSTWEITAARSVAVVEYLVSLGMPPQSLVAASAGQFDPIEPKDSPDGRARNRRVDISLLPLESELLPGSP